MLVSADLSAVACMDNGRYSPLFSSFNLGSLRLPNRLVMPAMSRHRADPGGVPSLLNAEYYAQRATAGLTVSEATYVSAQGQGYPNTPGIYSPVQVRGWSTVTDEVHSRGGRIFAQLSHVGRLSHPGIQLGGTYPVSASAVMPPGKIMTPQGTRNYVPPRALETWEVPSIVDQFRRAARNAYEAGFDGVEIHAGYGFLVDQFLRSSTNLRVDRYGGSVRHRVRFLHEVAIAVAEIMGAERVGVRITPSSTLHGMSDQDPEALFGYVAESASALGLAYLHVVQSNQADLEHGGREVPLSLLRTAFSGALIVNGGLDCQVGERMVASRMADLVAYGRLFLANPDLPERFMNAAPMNDADVKTFYTAGTKGYTDYPPFR